MAENITTLLDMDDAENISGDDYLYLVQGSGSKRDRKLKLSALFSSDPSHTLVVDSEDDIPGEFLLGKFDQYSHDVHYDTGGKVRFYADTTRAGRIIRGEPKNLDGSEFNTERVQFMAAVIDFGDESSADFVHNFHGTANFFFANFDQRVVVKNGGIVAGGGLSVPKLNAEGETLAKINGNTGDIETVGNFKGQEGNFENVNASGNLTAFGDISAGGDAKVNGKLDAAYDFMKVTDSTYNLTTLWLDGSENINVGRVIRLFNDYDGQCNVQIGASRDSEGNTYKHTVILNAGNCGEFIKTGTQQVGGTFISIFAPLSFSRTITKTAN